MTPIEWRSPADRLRLTIAAAMAAGLALSPRLWLSGRLYPLTPVLPALKPPAYPWDWALYLSLIASVAAIGVMPKPRQAVLVFAALMAAMVAFDQSRLQPWAYQYAVMLLAFAAAAPEASSKAAPGASNKAAPEASSKAARERAAPLVAGRLIVGCTYLWSGLQKLNPQFVGGISDWLLEPFAPHLPESVLRAAHTAGYVAPFFEAAIGVALLTGKFRRPAIFAAIGMHAYILLCIGPLGRNTNAVVWPWNVAMMICLSILFWRPGPVWTGGGFQWAALILFGMLPALSFFNLWDAYMSVSLYSGNQNSGVVYLKDDVFNRLPDELNGFVYEEAPTWNSISASDWSFGELNVPSYAEPRVLKNIARVICAYEETPGDVTLDLTPKWTLANRKAERMYRCAELKK